jgi:hypothetical protein
LGRQDDEEDTEQRMPGQTLARVGQRRKMLRKQ